MKNEWKLYLPIEKAILDQRGCFSTGKGYREYNASVLPIYVALKCAVGR